MEWLLFTSQLPANPSSLRVMVWRRMKAAGAVGLQNGVWVLPRTDDQERFLEELLKYLEEQGAEGQSFVATALNKSVEGDLLERFRAQRNEEYAELIERCEDMLAELDKETQKEKFTFAELEENEDDLKKLEVWLEKIRTRDYFGTERSQEATDQLEACRITLNAFADKVYVQEGIASDDHSSEN